MDKLLSLSLSLRLRFDFIKDKLELSLLLLLKLILVKCLCIRGSFDVVVPVEEFSSSFVLISWVFDKFFSLVLLFSDFF